MSILHWISIVVLMVHAELYSIGNLYYYNDIDLQINNLGVMTTAMFYYQKDCLNKNDNILLSDTKKSLGLISQFSPTDFFCGLSLRLKPLAILDIKSQFGYYYIFDSFGKITGLKGLGYRSLDSINAEYNTQALENVIPQNMPGFWFKAKPALQLKIKDIVIKNVLEIDYFRLQTNDKYFFNQQTNTCFRNRGIGITNSSFLLYQFNSRYLGFYNNYFKVNRSLTQRDRCGIIYIRNKKSIKMNEYYISSIIGCVLEDANYDNKLYFALSAGVLLKLTK